MLDRISAISGAAMLLFAPLGFGKSALGQHGIAATAHPLATEAALNAMKQGGNAIDAAVAAALTLGVVDGHNSGIGGGCFMLIRTAAGEFIAIDGRETAPMAATRDMFVRDGKADTRLSQVGALASGVPGALAAYAIANDHYGKLPLKTHLLNAAKFAEDGFAINRHYASRLAATASELGAFESSTSIFLDQDHKAFVEGHLLVQRDLAATYRSIAEQGIGWFYEGPFAAALDKWMRANGGLITREDMKGYRPKLREPIRTTYRGFEVVSFPPPSSGGIHVLQILNILEHFDLAKLGGSTADTLYVEAEAMKLAFADRAYWLGDPDFTAVPRGLIGKEYAQSLARQIDPTKAVNVETHGTPDAATEDIFGKHTTHFSTADAEGNWVACTATINTSFGSKVVVPGTGVLLNNEMDDFSIQPGVPNAFKLIGGEANAVAPGKRPLSSMSPTIVLRDSKPVLAIGAAGGPTIISQTVLGIINTIDFGMDVDAALAAPRLHHQWRPDELKIESSVGAAVINVLKQRGHNVAASNAFGATQAVSQNADGTFAGASDPRGGGKAEGW